MLGYFLEEGGIVVCEFVPALLVSLLDVKGHDFSFEVIENFLFLFKGKLVFGLVIVVADHV